MGRVQSMVKKMREDSENLLLMKNVSEDGKLPRDTFLERTPMIKSAKKSFEVSMDLDSKNEKRPKMPKRVKIVSSK